MDSVKQARRIVLLSSWYPSPQEPYQGIFVAEQARCLSQVYEVTVLTPRHPSVSDLLRLRLGPRLTAQVEQGVDTWRIRGLKSPPLRRLVPFLKDRHHSFAYIHSYTKAVSRGFAWYVARRGLPDLIHAHVVLPAGWAALQLGRRYGIPAVLTEHSSPFAMHLATPKLRQAVRDVLLGVDRIAAVGKGLRQVMDEFQDGLDIDVVDNLIDTDFFRPASAGMSQARPFQFFTLAFLAERKGLQFLLPALHMLRGQGLHDFELLVGGDGDYRRQLEQMAASLGLQDHCHFLGALSREQVRERMQECDVFVLPSLHETFGLVVAEAMACGKPVLATRCGGPEDFVDPSCGIIVPPQNSEQLAAAMADFMSRKRTWDAQAIRSSIMRRFGQVAYFHKHREFYAAALEKNRRIRLAS